MTTEARPALGGPEDPGLQPQRSAMAWSRASLASLANALLILRRDFHEVAVLVPGVLALAIGVATAGIGWQRRALLRRRPLPARLGASTQVHVLGWSVVVLSTLTLGFLIGS